MEMRDHVDRRGEAGAAAVTVAISLLLLIGFAALAIDTGLGYATRRVEQNGADNAALAAAWEVCNPSTTFGGDPVAAAKATALANGFDDAGADITVTVTPLGSDRFEVIISARDDTTFGRASPGAGSITVVSRAVARCEAKPILGGYAIFAGADEGCGAWELNVAGASQVVVGGIHSNGDLKITGASSNVEGDVTYTGASLVPTPRGAERIGAQDYPSEVRDITMDDFRPGGAFRDGSYQFFDLGFATITNQLLRSEGLAESAGGTAIRITRSGIYYTKGDIDLTRVSAGEGVRVTFVADDGQIHIRGQGSDLIGYVPIAGSGSDPRLLMFSSYREPPTGPSCSEADYAIRVSASMLSWTGVLYAPNGPIVQSAASSGTLNGAIFGHAVRLSGADFEVRWVDNPGAKPAYVVELVE